jgi:hypothetical protein
LTKRPLKNKNRPATIFNHQIVVLAAYLVGAQSASADTEDIAVKANELAPGRFSWRKYKDQINIDTVRKRLWDAATVEKGAYLIGSEKDGWRLTKAGYDFARKLNRKRGVIRAPKMRASRIERTAQSREVRRMLGETAFKKMAEGRSTEITKSDAERFFRLDDYVTGRARTAKIERFRILAAANKDLLAVIEVLAGIVREGGT